MGAGATIAAKTAFLNVDLDISSPRDLAPLAQALHPKLIALHVGRVRKRYWARLELATAPKSPDSAIRRLVSAIESLPRRSRACWNRATTRDFNIGIQAAEEPHAFEFALAPATVRMVGRVGARIVITVYGAAPSNSGGVRRGSPPSPATRRPAIAEATAGRGARSPGRARPTPSLRSGTARTSSRRPDRSGWTP